MVLVKEGFSWPAFFLSGLWALFHRMWLWAAVLITANIFLGFILSFSGVEPFSQGVMSFGFAVVIGYIGNDLRRRSLARRGYRSFGIVTGDNLSTAERRFLDNNPHWVSAFR